MNCPTANVPQKGARFYAEMIAWHKTISSGDSEGKNELEEEILPYDSDSDEEASYQGSVMSTDSQMSAASGLILKRKKETESIIEMQQFVQDVMTASGTS